MSGPLYYLSVIAIWATTPLAIKLSNDSLSPLAALGLRIAVATLCVLPLIVFNRRKQFWSVHNVQSYALGSISLFPNMVLVYYATNYISSGLISVMFGLSPFLIGLMAYHLLNENIFSFEKIMAQLFALAGLVIIFINQLTFAPDSVWGIVLMLGSITLYGYSLVAVKRHGRKQSVDAFDQTIGILLFSLPGIVITWYLIDGQQPVTFSTTSVLAVIYLALIGSLLGFAAFYQVLNKFSVTSVALIPMITPVLALWAGAIVADETITSSTMIGTGFILCGLALYQGLVRYSLKKAMLIWQSQIK